MTDKEFDNILRNAITSAEVPPELNHTLLAKAHNRKKAKMLSFIKAVSALAAVFICAIAIMSYYNPLSPAPATNNIPRTKKDIAKQTHPEESGKGNAVFDLSKDIKTESADTDKAATPEPESVNSLYKKESSPAQTSSRALKPMLCDLFNEGYDYKSVINERISQQLSLLPHAADCSFSGISGSETFTLDEENSLTIIVAAGENGEKSFTVGIVENGVLK